MRKDGEIGVSRERWLFWVRWELVVGLDENPGFKAGDGTGIDGGGSTGSGIFTKDHGMTSQSH